MPGPRTQHRFSSGIHGPILNYLHCHKDARKCPPPPPPKVLRSSEALSHLEPLLFIMNMMKVNGATPLSVGQPVWRSTAAKLLLVSSCYSPVTDHKML